MSLRKKAIYDIFLKSIVRLATDTSGDFVFDAEDGETLSISNDADDGKAKKDKCYYKVKSRYKKWPSAYASGALVKCRQVGAENWGNSEKKKPKKKKSKKRKKKASDHNLGDAIKLSKKTEEIAFEKPLEIKGIPPKTLKEAHDYSNNEISKIIGQLKGKFPKIKDISDPGRSGGGYSLPHMTKYRRRISMDIGRDIQPNDIVFIEKLGEHIKSVFANDDYIQSCHFEYEGDGRIDIIIVYKNLESWENKKIQSRAHRIKEIAKFSSEKSSEEETTELYSVTEEESRTQETPILEKLRILEDINQIETLKHVVDMDELSPSDRIRVTHPTRFTKNLEELTEIIENEEFVPDIDDEVDIFNPRYDDLQNAMKSDSKFRFLSDQYSKICTNAYNAIPRKFRLRKYDKESCFKVDEESPELCYDDMLHLSFTLSKMLDSRLDIERRMSLTLPDGKLNPFFDKYYNPLMITKNSFMLSVPAMFQFLFEDRDLGVKIANHIAPFIGN